MGTAAAFVLGAAGGVLGPAVGAGSRGWKGPAILALSVLALSLPLGWAALPLAGFALFAAGLGRLIGPAVGGLLACGLLLLPFVGDPLVEPGGPGKGCAPAISALVGGSPLCAAVGGGLGVDLLRSPRAYGGLSRIGAYYYYSYPRPLAAGAAWAAAGSLLLAGAGLASRRRGS